MRTTQVFVSYSHEDHRWVKPGPSALIPWLARALRRDNVEFWYDPALRKLPGEDFKQRILAEIDRADMACLLVSQDFLMSDFIRTVELPRIRERLEANEIAVVPILVGPALWEGAEELKWIAERQMLPGKRTPLIEYADDGARWQQVRVEILGAMRNRIEVMRQRPVPDYAATPEDVGNDTGEESRKPGRRRAVALALVGLAVAAAAAVLVGILVPHGHSDQQASGTSIPAGPAPATSSAVAIAPFTPSVTSDDVAKLSARAMMLSFECRKGLFDLVMKGPELKLVAEQAASDRRYEEDAPEAMSAAYRLYAASLIVTATGEPVLADLKQSLTWLRRAMGACRDASEGAQLLENEKYLSGLAEAQRPLPEKREFLRHVLGIAMVGANAADIDERIRSIPGQP